MLRHSDFNWMLKLKSDAWLAPNDVARYPPATRSSVGRFGDDSSSGKR